MVRGPPRWTLTDTLFPYTAWCRSPGSAFRTSTAATVRAGGSAVADRFSSSADAGMTNSAGAEKTHPEALLCVLVGGGASHCDQRPLHQRGLVRHAVDDRKPGGVAARHPQDELLLDFAREIDMHRGGVGAPPLPHPHPLRPTTRFPPAA